jgi:uncharacterized protein YuzE
MSKTFKIRVESDSSPVVELDSEAHAAYIRVSDRAVATTKRLESVDCYATVDYDSDGKTIGVELIGVQELRMDQMLEKAGISPLAKNLMDRASYVPASRGKKVVA